MFKNITINLEQPICKCSSGNELIWGIHIVEQKAGLTITCGSCKIEVKIPSNLFIANFNIGKAPSNYFDKSPLPDNVIKLRK